MPLSKKIKHILTILAFLCLLFSSCYLFFSNIDRSFSLSDESLHIQVTQEMWQTKRWWLPTHQGEPYFRKPPFKMWLTFIPLSIWGETNFAYRVLDASFGVLLVLAVAAFTFRLCGNPFIAVLAGFLILLNPPTLISSHGFRYATQDSLLRLLQFLALWIFYEWHQKFKNGVNRSAIWEPVLFGLCIGFAIFTKNILGFVAPGIAFVFLIVRLELLGFIKQNIAKILIALFLAVGIPALYMLPHFIFTEGAFTNLFVSEVLERSLVGEHHSDNPWFYLQRFWRPEFLPVSILAMALLFGFFKSTRGAIAEQYLTIWAITPLVVFSFMSSRLFWYIAESFTALAILSALSLYYLYKIVSQNKQWVLKIFALALIIVCWQPFYKHADKMRRHTTMKVRNLTLDRYVSFMKTKPEAKVLVYAPTFGYNEKYGSRVEKIYLGQLNPRISLISNYEDFKSAAKSGKYSYVITPRNYLEEIHSVFKPKEFLMLPPMHHRNERAFVLSNEDTGSPMFRRSAEKL